MPASPKAMITKWELWRVEVKSGPMGRHRAAPGNALFDAVIIDLAA
jgi:hypothetical protein